MINNINNKAFDNITSGFSVPTVFVANKKPTSADIPPQKPDENTNSELLKKQQNKTKIPLGKKVLYSVIALGSIAIILTKGLSGSTAKKLGRLADIWENNLLKKSGENAFVHYVDSGIINTSKFIKKMFSFSSSIANITTLKDTGFRKLYTLNFLRFQNPEAKAFPRFAKLWNGFVNLPKRFFDFSTKNILKITESAIDSRYAKVAREIDSTSAIGAKLLEKYNLPAGEKAELISEINGLTSIFQQGFSKISRNTRFTELEKGLSEVPQKVSEAITEPFRALKPKRKVPFTTRIKLFARRLKKNYSSYITVDQSKAARVKHQSAVNKARIAFSNDIGDVSKSLQNSTNELKHSFDANDLKNRGMIGKILRRIEKYNGSEESKQKITECLEKVLVQAEELTVKDKKAYTPQQIKELTDIVNSMKQTMTKCSEEGALQRLNAKMGKILSPEDYKIWQGKTQQLHTDFNKAVDAEMGNMVDKYAEAKVGSIATDVTSHIAVIGGGAIHIANGDDKKEKVGATLKAGSPILGGIATYFYSASRAFSGTTNLILTALSATILNRLGDSVFNYYQKRFIENKPVKEIAQEAVDEATKV